MNFPDKAKPSAKTGRKAADLLGEDGRAAEGRDFGMPGLLFREEITSERVAVTTAR
jgi:hypothetical protein